MSWRSSRLTCLVLTIAAVVLMAGRCLAVYYPLGPSKDEWGLKYEVKVDAADDDKVNVVFTLSDAGRLTPIYSATVIALSDRRSDGSHTFLAKEPIDLQWTEDGKLTGQTQIREELADRATIQILTLTFDGRRQTAGARSYHIPLKKFLNKTSVATRPVQ